MWCRSAHPMRCLWGSGRWEVFVPEIDAGRLYKFAIMGADGNVLAFKADPFALAMQQPPETASIVTAPPTFEWSDANWLAHRSRNANRRAPVSIYEVHLGSWRYAANYDGSTRPLTYDELGDRLIPYVLDLGFTHIELLPITEHPFAGSWGYQPLGLFAPTSRHGSPDDFRRFVDRCHAANIGVILDWVPGHFPDDPHGLGNFDGTQLYEYSDPRQSRHPDWNTLIFNLSRNEVRDYLTSNALFWLEEFHIDGLRVDAVSTMLYLNYNRPPEDWVFNEQGGHENLAAVDFLRRLNTVVELRHPDVLMIAEEATTWPNVSGPVDSGGLGFGYKWNMGWMNDILRYFQRDPLFRKFHHDELTFSMQYTFKESFILPISHDEVVHCKRSLLGRMPGDDWQRFANVRAFLGYMFAHPGKKLLFMGTEFAQEREWCHDRGLDWHHLGDARHAQISLLVKHLNQLYRSCSALHENDCNPDGFQWVDGSNRDASVLLFLRRGAKGSDDFVLVACNFTPLPRHEYRVGVPVPGKFVELLNTDSAHYGGSNLGNCGGASTEPIACSGFKQSLMLTLPPLSVIILVPSSRGEI
jgi:1,4-alpha-glucan branching enzyme